MLRRRMKVNAIDARRAMLAWTDLREMPLRRASHWPLLARCWELRDTVTPYGAAYVALAEALQVVLLTADTRLARAPGPLCQVDVLRPAR